MASLMNNTRIEYLMWGCMGMGIGFSVLQKTFGGWGAKQGGRTAKVFIELQRKSFHMIGGCIICLIYHYGIKDGYITPAFGQPEMIKHTKNIPLEGGACILAASFSTWMLEAARLCVPAVQKWYLSTFKGLIREKELNKGAGIAFFLPGSLCAFMAAPPNLAILGVLFLSVGDAGASIGTAAGKWPVFSSPRMIEGSIACWVLCSAMGHYVGLPAQVAMIASSIVTVGEVLAEIIGLDDNLVIPMLGVLGVRIALSPQFTSMACMMGIGLGIGVMLGSIVGATTAKGQGISKQK